MSHAARALCPAREPSHRARSLPALPRSVVLLCLKWVVTALALWLVLRSIDIGAVLDLIGRASVPALGIAAFVVAAQFVLLAWRWQLVIRILAGTPVGLGTLSVFLGHGFVIGQVLPSSVGADVARTVMLARETGTGAAARSVICDRLLGFASLALLVVPTLPIIGVRMADLRPAVTLAIAATTALAIVAVVIAAPSLLNAVPALKRPLATLAGDSRLTLWSGKLSLAATAAVGSNLLAVLLIYILGLSIGAHLGALDCLVLVPPALLASSLPISLGGWGVREGALLAAFSLVQADPAAVAATSVIFGLMTPLSGVAVAGAALVAGWRGILSRVSGNGV